MTDVTCRQHQCTIVVGSSDDHVRLDLPRFLLLLVGTFTVLQLVTIDATIVAPALSSWHAHGRQFDVAKGTAIWARQRLAFRRATGTTAPSRLVP